MAQRNAAAIDRLTITENVRGLYGPWTVGPFTEDSFSFTTVA
jgi:hypothetical protein